MTIQTHKMSLIESVVGTTLGLVISLAAAMVIYPLFGHAFTMMDNVWITLIFTTLSFIRGYVVRRMFNWIHHVGWENIWRRHSNKK